MISSAFQEGRLSVWYSSIFIIVINFILYYIYIYIFCKNVICLSNYTIYINLKKDTILELFLSNNMFWFVPLFWHAVWKMRNRTLWNLSLYQYVNLFYHYLFAVLREGKISITCRNQKINGGVKYTEGPKWSDEWWNFSIGNVFKARKGNVCLFFIV